MKKLTGTILITAVLLTHVGVIIATEEDYTFSSSEFEGSAFSNANLHPTFNNADVAYPTSAGFTSISKAGLFVASDQDFGF